MLSSAFIESKENHIPKKTKRFNKYKHKKEKWMSSALLRKMYSLPYHTHRWILGPLTNQRHIKYQLFARDIKLLHSIKCQISNSIVRECLSCALSNSNTVIGYKLAFYGENFNISILEHDLKYSLEHVKPEPLSIKSVTCTMFA